MVDLDPTKDSDLTAVRTGIGVAAAGLSRAAAAIVDRAPGAAADRLRTAMQQEAGVEHPRAIPGLAQDPATGPRRSMTGLTRPSAAAATQTANTAALRPVAPEILAALHTLVAIV